MENMHNDVRVLRVKRGEGWGQIFKLEIFECKKFYNWSLVFRSCPHPHLPNFTCSILVPAEEVNSLKWTHNFKNVCITTKCTKSLHFYRNDIQIYLYMRLMV